MPEYSLIISFHHFEPSENGQVQIIRSDCRNPGSSDFNKRLHRDEPIDIAQVRHPLEVADPALEGGEGKQLHELWDKVIPHRFQSFHELTSLPLDKFTGRNRQRDNINSNKHIADHNGHTLPSR